MTHDPMTDETTRTGPGYFVARLPCEAFHVRFSRSYSTLPDGTKVNTTPPKAVLTLSPTFFKGSVADRLRLHPSFGVDFVEVDESGQDLAAALEAAAALPESDEPEKPAATKPAAAEPEPASPGDGRHFGGGEPGDEAEDGEAEAAGAGKELPGSTLAECAAVLAADPYHVPEAEMKANGKLTKARLREAAARVGVSFPDL